MNKLGITENRLTDIEKQIVNLKLNLIDEYFTFNQENLDFNYLKQLHNFLFYDFYYEEEFGARKFDENEEKIIDSYFDQINYICIYQKENIKDILKLVKEIWHLQPFEVGNTRTLIAYLKILNRAFLLDLDIDVNKEIVSNPAIFDLERLVNQKRLTKNK